MIASPLSQLRFGLGVVQSTGTLRLEEEGEELIRQERSETCTKHSLEHFVDRNAPEHHLDVTWNEDGEIWKLAIEVLLPSILLSANLTAPPRRNSSTSLISERRTAPSSLSRNFTRSTASTSL